MTWRRLLCAATVVAALLALQTLLLPGVVRADEGMWLFNNVPRAELKRRYGFEVTDAWLRKAQLASVRFNNGGSGSFVSPDGLVLTNHHIASDTVAKVSTPQKDYTKEGFYARTRAEELRAPDLELNVLMSIEDVTDRVNGAVKNGTPAAEANAARQAAISVIEEESRKATGLRSDVVTLYQGGRYDLYRYKQYTDVRLVFAPETQIAFFGGDPDNFNYPRYCLDMALFRVYENDQPLRVENYFKWSKRGPQAGDLVFVTGHPGSTQRLNTFAHLEFLRDTGLPLLIKNFERRRVALNKYSALGGEQERRALEDLLTVENTLKVYRGQLAGLRDRSFMARKQQGERALRRSIAADARRQKEYGDAWDAIGRARRALSSYERDRRFLGGSSLTDNGWGFNSTLFGFARTLVRLAAENEKPNTERLPEYTDARRSPLELQLYSPAPLYEDFEKMKLADSLAFLRDEYGATHPLVERVLLGKTPEARAAELIDGTRLKDGEYRKQLAAGGRGAIDESTDPLIVLARTIDREARAARGRYEGEVTGVERTNYGKIARALFETEGTKLYPDATFTLRFSYGAVKGYREDNGKLITPFTNFAGLYARAAKHSFQKPYDLPPRWTEKKAALDLGTPFNFVTTNDITGGNSGSPIINRRSEIVGLVFDGNIQSLVGNFIYDETQNRTIAVDSRGMIEALRKVYGANDLADELTK